MRMSRGRVLAAALAGLLLLSGCETSTKLGDLFGSKKSDDPLSTASVSDPAAAPDDTTGSIVGGKGPPNESGLLGADPYDDLNTGKKLYRSANYGLAERYFRRAVEGRPKDAEAWIGLAACYDQLRRFELADRAYNQAIALIGRTPEVLNNLGYSYMLRSDYIRARTTLLRAREMDPANPYIQSNLETVEKALRKRKGVQQK
jgi:tetratricopeptide (TPR) repeat protein